jgi:hypothetical protein
VIYFNDHLNIKSQGQPAVEETYPLTGSSDNLINFPVSSNLEDQDVSKWVNILMNQSDGFPPQYSGDMEHEADRDPLDLLAQTLLDKGVL